VANSSANTNFRSRNKYNIVYATDYSGRFKLRNRFDSPGTKYCCSGSFNIDSVYVKYDNGAFKKAKESLLLVGSIRVKMNVINKL
jgi:hypothetical protein